MGSLTPTAIVLVGIGAASGILSSIFISREIEDVNRKLPANEQIELAYIYPGKMRKIKTAYKRLYPTGRIDTFRIVAQAVMFVCGALAAIAAGFLR